MGVMGTCSASTATEGTTAFHSGRNFRISAASRASISAGPAQRTKVTHPTWERLAVGPRWVPTLEKTLVDAPT